MKKAITHFFVSPLQFASNFTYTPFFWLPLQFPNKNRAEIQTKASMFDIRAVQFVEFETLQVHEAYSARLF